VGDAREGILVSHSLSSYIDKSKHGFRISCGMTADFKHQKNNVFLSEKPGLRILGKNKPSEESLFI